MNVEPEETVRRVLADVISVCADYLAETRAPQPTNTGAAPTTTLSAGDANVRGSASVTAEGLAPLLARYLRATPRTDHVGYANNLYGGVTLAGIVGEIAAAVSSTTVATYESAPAATRVEVELVKHVTELAGLPAGSDGVITSGGSQSNLVAMLCARHWKEPRAKEAGMSGMPRLVAFVSAGAHYSLASAANQLGIGSSGLRSIACGPDGRMLPSELEAAIVSAIAAGEVPFFVAATAGTPVLGAFDPIPEISQVARRHGLWVHVDGAWGGPVILSHAHRASCVDGLANADSFSMDLHKLMSVPLTCSVFTTRHGSLLPDACAAGNRNYIFHCSDCESDVLPDQGTKSLACGRRPDCLKAWMTWKYLGDDGYERQIDSMLALAKTMAQLVRSDKRLELLADPCWLNVCFRFVAAPEGTDLNALNMELRSRLLAEGWWLVNYATVGKNVCIRFVLTNFRLSKDDIRMLLRTVIGLGEQLAAEKKL